MIRSVRGNIPVVHFCFAGSRPAMTMLAVAPPRTTALLINLRGATLVLPIAIDKTNSPSHRPLPKRRSTLRCSTEIPIASDAPPRPTSRGFLPWRFADVGPRARGATFMGPTSENLHKLGSGQPVTRPRLAKATEKNYLRTHTQPLS